MNQSPPFRLPSRATDAHKGNFGRVMLVGGSRGMSGAIALSATAALRTGSGLVTAAVPDQCLESVAAFHPCIMTRGLDDSSVGVFGNEAASQLVRQTKSLSAIGCGPGMTTESGALKVVQRVLNLRNIPRVLDADAINGLAQLGSADQLLVKAGPIVLTPHPGELQRLTGVSSADREAQIGAAQQLACQAEVVVVVKGGPTVVVDGKQRWTNTTGNPGMATGGSGDVLTGVITSLLGQGMGPWQAACLGTWLHGLAGDIAAEAHGQFGMTAVEILTALPQAIRMAES